MTHTDWGTRHATCLLEECCLAWYDFRTPLFLMRVAAVQLPESWAVADGIGACRELAGKAAAEGAALAVFPELSLTG